MEKDFYLVPGEVAFTLSTGFSKSNGAVAQWRTYNPTEGFFMAKQIKRKRKGGGRRLDFYYRRFASPPPTG